MTPNGNFVINGAQRVCVSQYRSPGVFGQSYHANGTKLYSARVIPFKGSWIEFLRILITLCMLILIEKRSFL